jgi:hypothetical protein
MQHEHLAWEHDQQPGEDEATWDEMHRRLHEATP